MERRILAAAVEAIASQLAPRAQIVGAGSFGATGGELWLERASAGARRARLVFDLAPAHPALTLARPHGEPSEPAAFARALIGSWIVGIDTPAVGAVARISLASAGAREASQWLILEWLGGGPAALRIDASTGRVAGSLRPESGSHAARRAPGASYAFPSRPRRPTPDQATAEIVRSLLDGVEASGRLLALSRGFADLAVFLAYDALARGGEDPAEVARALRESALAPLRPALYSPRPRIADLPAGFVSPVALPSLESHRWEAPGALLSWIEAAHERCLRAEAAERDRARYRKLLAEEERRLMRLHERLSSEAREAAEAPRVRRAAETLLIHRDRVARGSARVALPDPSDPSRLVEIELDPALGAQGNAEKFFGRARRLERGAALRSKRLRGLEEAIARLAQLRARTQEAESDPRARGASWLREALGPFIREPALAAWERSAAGISPAATPPATRSRPGAAGTAGRRGPPEIRPRTYRTLEGWTILIGRSDEENDRLTHRVARPEDYWFHVHGCPGSHVILQREGRKDNPSARTIEEVAAIAAHFSRARTSRKVPVVYTLKKYVRKPRGGAPGLAAVTREKTILVEPKAPPGPGPTEWGP